MKILLLLFFCFLASISFGADTNADEVTSPAKLLALMSAGIGLFLIGVKYIGSHLEQISGGTFKKMVGKISNNPASTFVAGNALGFFTQSGKASSFILAGFVQAGLINVKRSLPIVYWCNAGASIIVLASALPIKMLVMYLLGITALGITFHWPKKLFHAYGAVFGIGIIMYGLFLLKSGAAGFIEYPWLPELLEKNKRYFYSEFFIRCIAYYNSPIGYGSYYDHYCYGVLRTI